jgi:hypothetical protein
VLCRSARARRSARLGSRRAWPDGLEHLAREARAVARVLGGRGDPDDDLVAVDLLEHDLGLVAHRRVDLLSSSSWTSSGVTPAASRARRSTPSGSRSGTIATLSTTELGTITLVGALRERRVEQAERADDALDLAGDAAALEADALADAERPRAQQDGARDEVAERLLRRETDDHRGEGTADGQRARVEPRRSAARR